MYTIELSEKAKKQLTKLPKLVQLRIISKIDALSINPRPLGVKVLRGRKALLRLRVGEYRVIYTIKAQHLLVLVVEIGHRREIYKTR